VFQIGRRHTGPHSHGKEIDDFLGLSAKQMSSQDAIRPFLYEYRETGICFPDPAR
jgi:hypothetical protein